MKQVTMESIQKRIGELTAGDVSLHEEFELACLQQLVTVTEHVRELTEQRDAMVAENHLARNTVCILTGRDSTGREPT